MQYNCPFCMRRIHRWLMDSPYIKTPCGLHCHVLMTTWHGRMCYRGKFNIRIASTRCSLIKLHSSFKAAEMERKSPRKRIPRLTGRLPFNMAVLRFMMMGLDLRWNIPFMYKWLMNNEIPGLGCATDKALWPGLPRNFNVKIHVDW